MMLVADRLLLEFEELIVEFAGELVKDTPVAIAFGAWLAAHSHRDRISQRVYSFRDVREAYRAADVAVIPTVYSEGTSLSCMEAMSCGIPVVSTNVGGLNDLITDGFNGRLVPPTEEALYLAIADLFSDEGKRLQLGANARLTAPAFDLSHWQQRWGELLEQQFALLERTADAHP